MGRAAPVFTQPLSRLCHDRPGHWRRPMLAGRAAELRLHPAAWKFVFPLHGHDRPRPSNGFYVDRQRCAPKTISLGGAFFGNQ